MLRRIFEVMKSTHTETSDKTFIGKVAEFPEILIESDNLESSKSDLHGAINHVILKNKSK